MSMKDFCKKLPPGHPIRAKWGSIALEDAFLSMTLDAVVRGEWPTGVDSADLEDLKQRVIAHHSQGQRLFKLSDMGPVLQMNSGSDEVFDYADFIPALTPLTDTFFTECRTPRAVMPDAAAEGRSHKCVVISGESGAGKTQCAVLGLPRKLFRADPFLKKHTMAVYFKMSNLSHYWAIDRAEKQYKLHSTDTQEEVNRKTKERNEVASKLLLQLWEDAKTEIHNRFPAVADKDMMQENLNLQWLWSLMSLAACRHWCAD